MKKKNKKNLEPLKFGDKELKSKESFRISQEATEALAIYLQERIKRDREIASKLVSR